MNIIEKFIKVLERYMDNLSIKKKFIQLYIFCVLLPLIITDSVVLYIEDSMESQRQYHEMANVANAVTIISVHLGGECWEELPKVCTPIEG